MASQVQPPLTHIKINSYFVDTLPAPYYDMLVGNTFLEFEDLLYAVGRIEYGIKKGRIANTEARVPEQKRNVVDEHIRATSCEKENKRKFNEEEKTVKNLSHSPQIKFLHSSYQLREGIQTSTQITLRVAKGRRPKSTMHSQYPMPSCFQSWSKNTRFLLFRLRLESLYIRNGMTSVLDVNTMAGLMGIIQRQS